MTNVWTPCPRLQGFDIFDDFFILKIMKYSTRSFLVRFGSSFDMLLLIQFRTNDCGEIFVLV